LLDPIVFYLLIGALAGVLAGLLGVGGGLVIVPTLVFVFHAYDIASSSATHIAVGTSLASIVFTSMSSIWAHHRRGAVMWPVFRQLVPGLIAGALIGAAIADLLSTTSLSKVFGVFELLIATYMLIDSRPAPHRDLPGWAGMFSAGSIIGTVSSIIGIGGGTMTVPFLVWCNQNMRNAVATSAACGLPIAVAGAAGFIAVGVNETGLPQGATGYLYWPAFLGIVIFSVVTAPLGARLAHTIPTAALKKFFALFLMALGIRMLWF
jgi:uncharacterized membrane protein YfcA